MAEPSGFCPSCSAAVPAGVRFCPQCGEAVSSVSQLPTGLATPSVARAVYLMASIGESREARTAGYIPKDSASTSATTHATTSPIGLTTSP